MNRSKFQITAILAIVLALATLAMAQPGDMMRMADKLKLTEQQLDQIQKVKFQFEKAMIQKRADLQMARVELKEIMVQSKIDDKAALSKQDKLSGIKGEIAHARLQHKLDVAKILTDEQRANFMKTRHEMGSRGNGPGRKGCCGPGGPGMMGGGPCMMGPGGPMGHGDKMPGMSMPEEKKDK